MKSNRVTQSHVVKKKDNRGLNIAIVLLSLVCMLLALWAIMIVVRFLLGL